MIRPLSFAWGSREAAKDQYHVSARQDLFSAHLCLDGLAFYCGLEPREMKKCELRLWH